MMCALCMFDGRRQEDLIDLKDGQIDALTAKLARAEAALDFAARTLRGEGCEDQGQAYDIAQRAIDAYFAEQEPRT